MTVTIPAIIEVSKLMLLAHGPPKAKPGQSTREAYELRYKQFRRWLTQQGVTVSNIGVRRVVYMSAIRTAWPELYESMVLTARTVCESCGEVPRCSCRRRRSVPAGG